MTHVEVDLDANPVTARRFSVLSLTDALIFDVDGRQRYPRVRRAEGGRRAVRVGNHYWLDEGVIGYACRRVSPP